MFFLGKFGGFVYFMKMESNCSVVNSDECKGNEIENDKSKINIDDIWKVSGVLFD